MKNFKIRFHTLKSVILLAILALMGFAACDDEDIQPEYGVPVVRDKSARIEQQRNDNIANADFQNKKEVEK